jgi:hypothetical protein
LYFSRTEKDVGRKLKMMLIDLRFKLGIKE